MPGQWSRGHEKQDAPADGVRGRRGRGRQERETARGDERERERERDRPKDVVGLFLSPAAQVETMEIPLKKYLQQNKFNYSN